MKRYILFFIIACMAVSCGEKNISPEGTEPDKATELTPVVVQPQFSLTKATPNYNASDYFSISGFNKMTVNSKIGVQYDTAIYYYQSGTLTAHEDTLLWYPNTGTIDTLQIRWPESHLRTEVPLDQTERGSFLTADWLLMDTANVEKPDQDLLKGLFVHERNKITIELDNKPGYKITVLWLGEYRGYIDPALSVGQLIVDQAAWDAILQNPLGVIYVENTSDPDDSKYYNLELQNLPQTLTPGGAYVIPVTVD